MAPEAAPILAQEPTEPNNKASVQLPNNTPMAMESIVAVNEEIPTIDYSLLISNDPDQRSKALEELSQACEEYGFFNVVNGIPEDVVENALKEIAHFFKVTEDEKKRKYLKKSGSDTVVYGLNSYRGQNREYMKVCTHPQYHCPHDISYRDAFKKYTDGLKVLKIGLARAMSRNLGQEENYFEKVFNLESGFDICAINVYPPISKSKSTIGLPNHTDPGFCVSLAQDVNGGLRVLTHQGKWINVTIPPNAILIQLGDHLEVLTNGRYKSHLHNVLVNNKVQRISLATLHGPAIDNFVSPAPEFVDESHPPAYRGMTYKDSLENNNHDIIDVETCLEQLRI